jgi:hypothetical protein
MRSSQSDTDAGSLKWSFIATSVNRCRYKRQSGSMLGFYLILPKVRSVDHLRAREIYSCDPDDSMI